MARKKVAQKVVPLHPPANVMEIDWWNYWVNPIVGYRIGNLHAKKTNLTTTRDWAVNKLSNINFYTE